MGQTSYSIAPKGAHRGMLFGLATEHVIRTVRLNAGSARPFGTFVIEGGAATPLDGDVTVLADANSKVAGVLVHTHDIRQDPSTTALVAGVDVPDGSIVPLLEKGKIAVMLEQDVVAGDPVYARHTANGAGKLVIGAARKDADTANALLVKGAKFIKVGKAADGFGFISFDVNAALT